MPSSCRNQASRIEGASPQVGPKESGTSGRALQTSLQDQEQVRLPDPPGQDSDRENQVDPSHILVLTFTNKAFRLVERLRVAGIKRAADVGWNFPCVGLEFLRKYYHVRMDSGIVVADKLNAVVA
jgi:hypothetical protein